MDPAVKVEVEAMKFLIPIDEATGRGDSEIQLFYQDAVVFITGATGFMGKQLLEKLFRSCDIKKAFVLIRPKKDKSAKERLQVILNDPILLPLLTKKPDVANKIVCVEGDASDFNLGISNDDWIMMAEEVDVIFHGAATVKFDEKIRKATMINVRGTREALKLGKACKGLKSFVHISTAYSPATSYRIKDEVLEQFYKTPIPPETLLTLVETVDEERLGFLTESLIRGWPNTYTFTKAVADELIRTEGDNLPICVVRPSIIFNTYREPVPGWLDGSCKYGPGGILFGCVMGVIRVLFVDSTLKFSLVPVDFVNNATIAAGWYTGIRRAQVPLIYNITNTSCGVTVKDFTRPMIQFCRSLCSPATLWYCYCIETNNRCVHLFLSWILHYIPAYIADIAINLLKVKKPSGLKSVVYQYTKFDKLSTIVSYFATNAWIFNDTNLQNVWQNMSPTDKTIFNFDIKCIDWNHYSIMSIIGVRKYVIKDGLKGTEKAVNRQKWLKMANYAVLFGYLTIFRVVLSRLWWLVRLLQKTATKKYFAL